MIGSGFFLALVIGEGGEYIFVIIISFLLLYGLLYIRKRNFSMLAKSVIVGTLAGLFGAVKILPFLALMRTVPRTISDYSGFSLKSFTISLLYPHQGLFSPIWRNLDAIRGSYGPDENGMYVGGLTAVLAIIGMIYLARKDWRILAIFGVFCLFIFGDRLPVSLWALVRRLPVYHSMRVAQRLRFVFLMLLALFSGFGITLVWKKIMAGFFSSGIKAGHRRLGPILLAGFTGLIALNAIHMIFVNSLIFRDAFSIQPLKTVAHTDFKQISFSLNYDNTGLVEEDEQDPISSGSAYYYSYLNNWGTSADCLSHYGLPRNAQAYDSIDYKGELYFAGGSSKIIRSEWTPNKITAEVKMREKDRLVLNQNYYPGWHAESNTGKSYPVEKYRGLLSVQIDREVTGIRLFYRPTEFVIGLLITVVTCLISMGVIIRPGR
ncbi:MAG TPA: hypothetical protein ENH12_06445 [Proteobacteria bacterium]|nr:hypothetical protein [Pseudomonadota bacterium]